MVTTSSKSDTLARLLGRLADLCDSGFALAIHIRLTRPSLLFQTYDSAWSDHYSVNGYMLSDPVVHFGLTRNGRVAWDALTDQDSAGVLKAARDFGLYNGWTYATGQASSKTIAGMTRSDRGHDAAEIAEIEAIVEEIHALTEDFADWPAAEQERVRRLIP